MTYHVEVGNEHSMGKSHKIFYVVDEHGTADIECHNEDIARRIAQLLNGKIRTADAKLDCPELGLSRTMGPFRQWCKENKT